MELRPITENRKTIDRWFVTDAGTAAVAAGKIPDTKSATGLGNAVSPDPDNASQSDSADTAKGGSGDTTQNHAAQSLQPGAFIADVAG